MTGSSLGFTGEGFRCLTEWRGEVPLELPPSFSLEVILVEGFFGILGDFLFSCDIFSTLSLDVVGRGSVNIGLLMAPNEEELRLGRILRGTFLNLVFLLVKLGIFGNEVVLS